MRLICLTGKLKNRTIAVPATGITIGREIGNDLVLADDAELSRQHASLERQPDASWQVTDLHSRNGVRVNGQRINGRQPLHDGDVIRIGHTELRVELSETPLPDDAVTPVVSIKKNPLPDADNGAAPNAGAAADTGQVPVPAIAAEFVSEPSGGEPVPQDGGARNQAMPRLRLALLLIIILMLMGFVVVWLKSNKRQTAVPPPPSTASPAEAAGLQLFFERVEANPKVLFRYELRLRDGKARLFIDDVINSRRVEEEKKLNKEQLEFLASSIMSEGFLKLEPVAAEPGDGTLNRTRLMVMLGTRGNYVEVQNTTAPEAFTGAVLALINFMQGEFGIFATPMPREEVIKAAEEEYLSARRYLAEYSVDPANLYRAAKAYQAVVDRVAKFDDKPEWYGKAREEAEQTRKMLDAELTRLLRDAAVLKSAGNLEEARQMLTSLLTMVPDRDHDVARQARQEILRLNQMLQARQKKR